MICFDMDGVLVKYERDAYTGDHPRYLQPGYFRQCKPDYKAISLINYCIKMLPLDTFIATHVVPKYRNAMIIDKLEWIGEHIPNFDIGTRFIGESQLDKSALFEHVRMSGLTSHDVLIDDYNPRLYNWEMRGGTAIKYLNGLNSEDSWHGTCINPYGGNVEDLFMIIMRAISCK